MKTKILFYAFLVAMTIASLALTVRSCEQKQDAKQEIDRLLIESELKRHAIDSLKAQGEAFKEKMRLDSLRYESARKAFKTRIAGLQVLARSVKLSAATPQQLDSVTAALILTSDTSTYCMPLTAARKVLEDAAIKRIQDTMLVVSAQRIEDLHHFVTAQAEDFNTMLTISESENRELEGINDRLEEVIQAQRKAARRKAFGSFMSKVGAVAVGVGIGAFIAR